MSLPRDILRWIQSLDLSYSIKSVRRDFSNGFLVAEMVSRYHKNQINMHSYDNGTSLRKRRDNWEQLRKVFQHNNWSIQWSLVEEVINCQAEAAVALIEQIYTMLTDKEVQHPVPREEEEYTPPFARPTATMLIKERLRAADLQAADDVGMAAASADVVDGHNETLRKERTLEPERFLPPNRSAQSLRVSQRTVGLRSEEAAPQIQFKQVHVRQIDDSKVSSLRQARSGLLGGQPSSARSLGLASSSSGGGTGGVGSQLTRTSLDIMDSVVKDWLKGSSVELDAKAATQSFVRKIRQLPGDFVTSVFSNLNKSQTSTIADNCLLSPKDFWQFFGLMWTALTALEPKSKAFSEAMLCLEMVGRTMNRKDQETTTSLFQDFGLPKMLPALQLSPPTPPALVRVLYAFAGVGPDEHIIAIRALRDGLKDHSALVRCLGVLVRLETEFSAGLLDLYLYYIVSGLRNASATVRATSVSMLSMVAKATDVEGHKHVCNMLDRLEALMEGDNAQVNAQLVGCFCSLLSVLPTHDPSCDRLYANVQVLLGISNLEQASAARASGVVLKAGLVALTQCVGTHPPMLSAFSALAFTREDISDRAFDGNVEGVFGLSGADLGTVVDSKAVALAVTDHVTSQNLGNLGRAHILLLAAATNNLMRINEEDAQDWQHVYATLRDHLVVELCDPNLCQAVLSILSVFLEDPVTSPDRSELFASTSSEGPPLSGALALLFPRGDPACQQMVAVFLEQLAARSEEDAGLVQQLLEHFAAQLPEQFNGSILQSLLQ